MVKINEITGLFWGVTLEGNKKYTQTPERPVHISMAALDTTHPQADGSTASVMIDYNGSSFVLCTLQHGRLFQQPLDLEFAAGETLSFYITGKGSVHLSGYCLPEEDMGQDYDDLSEPESEEEDLSNDSDDADDNTGGKRKLIVKGGKNAKKARMTIDDLDEDDEDDSDDDFIDWEAEEGSDDDDDEDELQDDFDEESDEEEDKSPKPGAKKAKLGNGTSAKAAVVNVKSKEKTNETKASSATASATTSQPQKSDESGEAEGKKKKKKKNKKKNKNSGANQQQDSETKPGDKKTPVESKLPTKRTAEGGVVIEDLKEGHGPEAKIGKMVRVYYTGRLPNGKMFDSCLTGNGFKFKLGKKEVISGWDVGLAGMKVGGKRKLVIPPKMGYGSQSAGVIPPNSTLVFDVELKAVN